MIKSVIGAAEIVFGDGKICIAPVACKNEQGEIVYGMFLSELEEEYNVGDYIEHVNEGMYDRAPVKLFFKNKESIDVLIEQLQELKHCYSDGE